MMKNLATIGTAAALLAFSAVPALAHPGQPDINFAALHAHGGDCSTVRYIPVEVHDAAGNTYSSPGEACAAGVQVVWLGPAH